MTVVGIGKRVSFHAAQIFVSQFDIRFSRLKVNCTNLNELIGYQTCIPGYFHQVICLATTFRITNDTHCWQNINLGAAHVAPTVIREIRTADELKQTWREHLIVKYTNLLCTKFQKDLTNWDKMYGQACLVSMIQHVKVKEGFETD